MLGVGEKMKELIDEFQELKKNNFQLDFVYPTEEARKQLNIVNRDMTEEEKTRVKKKKDEVETLISDLETGRLYIEDLGDEQISRLEALLKGRKNDES